MRSSRALSGLAIAALAAVTACGVRTVTADLNPSFSRPPTCDEAIVVYRDLAEVPHDYHELAFISAEANSVYTREGQILRIIRKRAAEVGANAVIANPTQASSATVKVLGEAIGTKSATAQATALAIYMPADSERLLVQCGTQ